MDALITITNIQTVDGEDEKIFVSVVGTFEGDENDFSLSYPELEGELKGCTTSIRCVGKSRITIARSGNYESEMTLEAGKRHTCVYSTPHGDFTMGLFASEISSCVKESGGTLNFNYSIDFNIGLASLNSMEIIIEPQNGGENV